MTYFFAEIKDRAIFSLHESSSLDLIFRDSDGLLVELTEQEYMLIKASKFNLAKGISILKKLRKKIK